jgi:hypothetical protein
VLFVASFAATCIAALAADGDAGDAAVWVSHLSSRLSGQIDGEFGGMTFELRVALCAPVSVGLTIATSATR